MGKKHIDMRENGVLGDLVFKGNFDTKKYFISIDTEELAKKYKKDKGNYFTLNTDLVFCTSQKARNFLVLRIKEILKFYFDKFKIDSPCVMVVGLGNAFLVADSLGALVVKNLLSTHNIPKSLRMELGDLCALIPGVSGINGFETADIVKGVVDKVKPDIVIVIDALTSKEPSRIGCSFQFSDTNITPGAGLGNKNKSISKNTLKTNIICVGVPMMISANDLGANLKNFVVTPKEIDIYTKNCAKVISCAINELVHTKKYKDFL